MEKDERKARPYYQLAAIGGDAKSRHNLGVDELQAGNMDKAIKHFLIVAGFGHTGSLKSIKLLFLNGEHAKRDDYQQALLSYQQYIEEVGSDQRDAAVAFSDWNEYLFV